MRLSRNATVVNELGLHARAAAKIAHLAKEACGRVLIIKDGREIDATSILDIISLYCPRGTEVTVQISDPADDKVLNGITRLIETGFGEI